MAEEEGRILRVIRLIKDKRKKACYQSILDFACRENNLLNMAVCKYIVNDLVKRNILVNIGRNKKSESFIIVGADSHTQEEPCLVNQTQPSSTQITLSDETCDEKYIDDKFYDTLKGMIKAEVNTVFAEQGNPFNNINSSVNTTKECKCNNDLLIKSLNDHIAFLQKELASKDMIIKMLINDRRGYGKEHDYNDSKSKCANDNKMVVANTYDELKELDLLKDEKNNLFIANANKARNISERRQTCEYNKDISYTTVKRKKANERSIAIIGDSMVKDVDPFDLRKKLNDKKSKVYRHNFNGATIDAMKHHSIPVMEFDPDLAILHVGTNSLRGGNTEGKIADDILSLASRMKKETNEIIVSSIIARRDQYKEKAEKVNDFLQIKCSQVNMPFIRHNNIRGEIHLKPKGLHLNYKGSSLLSDNFVNWINT